MALLDATARAEIRAVMARVRPQQSANAATKAEMQAAIDATDSWIDSNAASFNAALPEPVKSNATQQEKTILFCYVALKRAGLLGGGI